MSESVSREEHLAAIARLDAADVQLRTSMADIERALRVDYEGKIAVAVSSLSNTMDQRFDHVDGVLEDQNEVLFKKRFQISDISLTHILTLVIATVAAALVLHFGFHV